MTRVQWVRCIFEYMWKWSQEVSWAVRKHWKWAPILVAYGGFKQLCCDYITPSNWYHSFAIYNHDGLNLSALKIKHKIELRNFESKGTFEQKIYKWTAAKNHCLHVVTWILNADLVLYDYLQNVSDSGMSEVGAHHQNSLPDYLSKYISTQQRSLWFMHHCTGGMIILNIRILLQNILSNFIITFPTASQNQLH